MASPLPMPGSSFARAPSMAARDAAARFMGTRPSLGVAPTTLLVASGKGGVGTSMIATLTAFAAAERERRVLLVDATESNGTLHHLFGLRPAQSLWRLIDSRVRADDVLVTIDDQLSLVPGGTSANATAPASDQERRMALTRLAAVYGDYSLVVFDGGSRLDTITAISELVDPRMLLVTSADRLALAANYALVKATIARQPEAPISILINRHGDAVAAEASAFLVGACSHFLGRPVEVAGTIPDDPSLLAAVGAGMAVRDAADGSPAADAVRGVVPRVLPSQPAASVPAPAATVGPFTSSRRWS